MFKGSGLHHVAIGTQNLNEMKSFYLGTLGFSEVFFEHGESEQIPMHRVLRSPSVIFSAILFNQPGGKIMLELVHLKKPEPRPIRRDFKLGDIGVSKITISVTSVPQIYRELKGKVNFCSSPKTASIPGWGDYQFIYCKDPEGNPVEFCSAPGVQIKSTFGGISSVGISVTDLPRSIYFYQKYLGFNKIFLNTHDGFSENIDEISGYDQTRIQSCMLSNSNGGGMVELFEVTEPRGRSIPFGSNWGDFGYLQVCSHCENIREMKRYCEGDGIEFLSDLEFVDDGVPEHAALFMYMKDPDGIPVELISLVNSKVSR